MTRVLAAGSCLLLSLPGCQCPWSSCSELLQRWPDGADQPSPAVGGHRLCPKCGKPIPEGENGEGAVGYYNHPRFHPVPTQPVFTPRCDMTAASPCNHGMDLLPDSPKPMLQPAPSAPGTHPEEVPVPSPAQPSTGQGTSVPGQLAAALTESSSWLFSSPRLLPRTKDQGDGSVSDSASDSRTMR